MYLTPNRRNPGTLAVLDNEILERRSGPSVRIPRRLAVLDNEISGCTSQPTDVILEACVARQRSQRMYLMTRITHR